MYSDLIHDLDENLENENMGDLLDEAMSTSDWIERNIPEDVGGDAYVDQA